MEQVGAYLAESGMSAAQYLVAWRSEQAAPGWAAELSRSDRIMTGVWRATLERLSDTPLAGQILRVLAWLAPEGVPVAWLVGAFGDGDGVREALRRLNAFSMVSLGSDGTVAVHRAVQAVSRTAGSADGHRRPEAIAAAQCTAVEILAGHLPDGHLLDSGVAKQWRTLMPHVESFAVHASGRPAIPAVIRVMDRALEFWCAYGNPAAGVSIAACSLVAEERHHGSDHPDTLNSRNSLAYTYRSAGRTAEAIALFEATLDDCERVLGPDHQFALRLRSNLAYAYEVAGRVAEAIALYEATLDDCERVLGPDHRYTLRSRGNLAYAYGTAGRVAEAIALFEATFADGKRVLGSDHLYALSFRSSLAYAYRRTGRVADAIALYEATLAGCERTLGLDHPYTLISRSNLAYAYGTAGRVAKAIALFEATLDDCERVLGSDHPTTEAVRENLVAVQTAGD